MDESTSDTISIGVTVDIFEGRYRVRPDAADAIAAAGAVAFLLPAIPHAAGHYARLLDGFVLTGGDDPDTRFFGVPVHKSARLVDPRRQAFESALLAALEDPSVADRPVLGICLGMQMMGLHGGGTLDQHLPDHLPTAAEHWGDKPHIVDGVLGKGTVCSHHRQALRDAGRLRVTAQAGDGVIEAIDDPAHAFRVGVQWHPERTEDPALGFTLFRKLVDAARSAKALRQPLCAADVTRIR